jgi:hypothetical protein
VISLLNLNATNHTIFTIFIISGIVYFVVGVIAFLIGRPWIPR